MLVLFIVGLSGISGTYSALAIYKAIDYTTTPRQTISNVSPADFGLSFEDVTFQSRAGDRLELGGWWIENDDADRAIILVHGRYQNRTSMLTMAKSFWARGYSVLLFDLRGHGASPEARCTYGLQEQWDVIGAVDYVERRQIARNSIGVLGWSLGASSALMAMEHEPGLSAVVSDSAYANDDPLLARNPLRPGLKLALRIVRDVDLNKVAPERSISRAQYGSVLLIHGANDLSVPVKHANRLEQHGADRVAGTWIVPNAGHIGAYAAEPDEYIRTVLAFFDNALK